LNTTDYINIPQYSLNKQQKETYLVDLLTQLHDHHKTNCEEYNKISTTLFNNKEIKKLEDVPYLPIQLFKNYSLKSIPEDKIYKTLSSSGTTGSKTSKIYLDSYTSQLQTLALSKIFTHIIGTNNRLPMLIIDSRQVLKDKTSFSARGAGILGMSVFGKNHCYLLDDNYEFNDEVIDFLDKFNNQKILVFGFTFMIYKYLIQYNQFLHYKNKGLQNSILVHSGGWKKMQEQSVDNNAFKKLLKEKLRIETVYNFYGMAEQVGSVFVENSDGYLHCPNYSDIIIRNPKDLSECKIGEEGIVQVLSMLPYSYPGHSILTEDIGVCLGEDDSSNGWKGKYFKILGRIKQAELRGCSDIIAKSE